MYKNTFKIAMLSIMALAILNLTSCKKKKKTILDDNRVTITTNLEEGKMINIIVDADQSYHKDIWIDLDNNKDREEDVEDIKLGTSLTLYTLKSKTIVIYGKINKLHCIGGQITDLDISQNNYLTEVNCQSNELKSLNISNNTHLEVLNFANNKISSIDFTDNSNLRILDLAYNKVSDIDLSNNTQLEKINFTGNKHLKSINVANGNNQNITEFKFWDCELLTCIQIDKRFDPTTSSWDSPYGEISYSEDPCK